jgi:hypothetical protein
MSPAFVEARRAGLEQYLKTLIMAAPDRVLRSNALDRFLEVKQQMAKVRFPSTHTDTHTHTHTGCPYALRVRALGEDVGELWCGYGACVLHAGPLATGPVRLCLSVCL